jgi:adenylate cyclase
MAEDSASTKPTETRRLAAIMFTDIVGFSRQMGSDEARTLRLLDTHNQIIQQAVVEHHGAVIKTVGDAFLVDFPSVVHAVQCAQQIQSQFKTHNTGKEAAEQIHIRIGIHSGDIVQRDGDVFGDGVNIASRLQTLAEPDSICISQVVYQEVSKKLDLGTMISLGKPSLKNIAERFPIYALLPEAPTGVRRILQGQRVKLTQWRRTAQIVAAVVVLVWAGVVTYRLLSPASPTGQPREVAPTSPQPALPLPDKPSIVVLPFTNMSKDPEQDYFSDGITEVLTSDLSRISSLFVIARNTAFTYKGKATNVQEVSKELGVRYVLEGSIQKAGEQVRITAQLIDAITGGHVWTERFDRPFKDIFALQDEIVQKIVTTLKLQLTLEEQGYVVRKRTDNLQAYDAVLRGVEYYHRLTKEANLQGRQMFEKAIELDPQYAEAYARLGWTYRNEWGFRWSADPQTLERMFEMAQKAIALDASLPMAHSLLSIAYSQKHQYDQALAEGERAVALDPNHADSYAARAQVLTFAGRPEEALRMVEQAMRLNPRCPPWYLFWLGAAYQMTGRYAEAIATQKEVIRRDPNFIVAHNNLAWSYWWQWVSQQSPVAQTLAPAVAAGQRALALNDSYHRSHIVLGWIYLSQQQYDQALAEMERAVALAPTEAWSYAGLAEVLSYVGRTDDALKAATQALHLKPIIVDAHLASVGAAYAVAGRPEEAIAPLQRYISRYPNILGAHLTLAAVYSELSKEAEAHAEAAEVLRLNPNFSLEVHKERMPIKDPALLERHIAALRKAGLK